MMSTEKLKKATVVSTGKKIEVYQSKSKGTWIDYSDCTTEYSKDELRFS